MIHSEWVVKSVAQWGEQYSIVKPRRAGASEESFWQMPAAQFTLSKMAPDAQW